MRNILFLFLFLMKYSILSCGQNSYHIQYEQKDKNDSLKSVIFKKISKLKDVQKIHKEVVRKSKNLEHLSYIMRKTPTKEFRYYWVQVGINKEERFMVLLNYYVDVKKNRIYLYDPINDTKVLIK